MKIYIVRHGQTQWNTESRMQGALDSPLTQEGIRAAHALKEKIKDLDLDAIYTSPQGRALTTAQILRGDRDLALVQDPDLRELSVKIWEGRVFDQVKKTHPQDLHRYLKEPQNYHPPGEENYYDLMDRARGFLNRLKAQDHKNVLVVSHGVTINALLNVMEGIPVEDFWKKPLVLGTELSLVEEKDGVYQVIYRAGPVNDVTY